MRIKIFKPFVCLIAITVLFSGFGEIQAEESFITEDTEVVDSLSNADIIETKSGEVSKVSTLINDEEISLNTTLTNNFETGDINLNGKISNSKEMENVDYYIDLTYADENDIAGYLIDNKTGEEHPFDTRLSEASAVPLVVVAVMAARFGIQWAIKKYGKKAVNTAIKSSTHRIAKSINKKLLNQNGVDIRKFTQKVNGQQTWKDPKTGWKISKDRGDGHGGSYYKLIDNRGKRIATLTKNGKILRK